MEKSESSGKSGMAARAGALRLIHAVLSEKALLDDAYAHELAEGPLRKLTGNDRAFAKRIATTVLQHLGEIDTLLARFMDRGIPKKSGPLRNILRIGTAELLFLNTPPHAVVDCAVSHYRTWRKYAGFKGLTNAVLRRVSKEGPDELASIDPAKANLPEWMYKALTNAYGTDATAAMMVQYARQQIPLDLSLKDPASADIWAERLGAEKMPTGSLRLASHERVDLLEGYAEGAWWVQDAAATLPVQMFGDVAGRKVLDLCAAPGGKTMQLAALGADVTALDISAKRLARIEENLQRVGLKAELVKGDVLKKSFDEKWPFILLDAPCSATGTVRRHPELIHQRSPEDIEHFSKLQAKMLDHVAELLAPGGTLVFCTCSLQPEEGPGLIADFLMNNPDFGIDPLTAEAMPQLAPFIEPDGSLRTRPDFWPEAGGMDGFFAIRLRNYAPS
ncbi:RsmB/NOP family class I SAM-dependent RNA methyltransferase [Cohaesibacter haloalkalitolerans]|uniref:RsmB/NOP family class I SAM-dependent RNA methyltransferase n=1 Tax=Cohaesibacter haloalkalitolerans TaxID=1162980 RepID=UPI000E65E7D7|nr:transcription antitermination factor NusB [Cohaesibacter haloalkalitolerans]